MPWYPGYWTKSGNVYTAHPAFFVSDLPPDLNVSAGSSDRLDISYPSAQTNIPIPYIIGRKKIERPNTIWLGDLKCKKTVEYADANKMNATGSGAQYQAGAIYSTDLDESGGGGEGGPARVSVHASITPVPGGNASAGLGGGGDTTRTGTIKYVYTMDMQIGLCLGQGVKLLRMFSDDGEGNLVSVYDDASGAPVGEAVPMTGYAESFTFYNGDIDQAPSDVSAGKNGDLNPGYPGLAYIAFKNSEQDTPSTTKKIGYECERLPDPLGLGEKNNKDGDVNLATAFYDVLTSRLGGLGIDPVWIDLDGFKAAGQIFHAEGNFCSLYFTGQAGAKDALNALMAQGRFVAYTEPKTGKLTIKCIREATGTAIVTFNESNIESLSKFEKSTWTGLPTTGRLKWTNRADNYNGDIAFATLTGIVNENAAGAIDETMTGVHNAELAQKLISRDLALAGVPQLNIGIVGNRDGASCRPGDIAFVTLPTYGVKDVPIVITEVRETGDKNDFIIVEGISTVIGLPSQLMPATSKNGTGQDVTNKTVDIEKITSVPYFVAMAAGGLPRLSVMTDPDNRNPNVARVYYPIVFVKATSGAAVGGCDIEQEMGYPPPGSPTVVDKAIVAKDASLGVIGTLQQDIGMFDGYEFGFIPTVRVKNVQGMENLKSPLDGSLSASAFNSLLSASAVNLFFVGNEYLQFEKIELDTATNEYVLTNVWRGRIDTGPLSHKRNDRVYFLHDLSYVSKLPIESRFDNTSIDITAYGLNSTGRGPGATLSYEYSNERKRFILPLCPVNTQIGDFTAYPRPPRVDVTRGVDYPFNVSWDWRTRDSGLIIRPGEFDNPESDPDKWYNIYVRNDAGYNELLYAAAFQNTVNVFLLSDMPLGHAYIAVEAESRGETSIAVDVAPINVIDPA